MTKITFHESVEDGKLAFAVILSRSAGKWVLCKHRARTTLEVPGGHREPGEAIMDTAVRELREETGAEAFSIRPVCVYAVERDDTPGESWGLLCWADIRRFAPELHSEIERIFLLDRLPENWTYPDIQPALIREAVRRGFLREGEGGQ